MSDVTAEQLLETREIAESTQDQPLSASATRPGHQRAKVLSVRLNPEEFEALTMFASELDVPTSSLVRGWILEQLRGLTDSPQTTVERIARDIELLRSQIVA